MLEVRARDGEHLRATGYASNAPVDPLAFVARHWLLLAGLAVLILPTFVSVAQESWSTEQGAHGPIVLATGIWLVMLLRRQFIPLIRPGKLWLAVVLLIPCLALYTLGRLTGTLEMEGFMLYASLVVVTYAMCGTAAMRVLWFPIVYFAFLFPPPDQLVVTLTQPLKLAISHAAVGLLGWLGFAVARTGVIIQIDQYDILVAAACAGLNSIISLSAIGLFYIYFRHNANWRYAGLLMLAIVPIAIFANFVRVVALILITYYLGDAWAQGFLHGFAGMLLFTIALLGIFGLDSLVAPLRQRLGARPA